ncbi:glycoside hydrolase family 3 C-terminal domain-containing protein [Streptomyces sp. NPDC020719]|uniref:glycoside hydrolase family 3 C-terminal domain-containing protein n=1 Tax=Streptomyces sp. NPDC020719 TaxID=3154896 RepID=UPI0033CAB208
MPRIRAGRQAPTRTRIPLPLAMALATGGVGALAMGTPAASATTTSRAAADSVCPWVHSTAPIPDRVGQLLARMTTAQKVTLATGAGGSRYTGFTPGIGALCIPAMDLEDGPAGVGHSEDGVTQLPAPVSAAATWDTRAEQDYGRVIGAEQAAKGANVDLGPTINIDRDPRWGRAFESMGEDPYLNGQLSAANIRGVQSTGVLAQVKHLAVYNQENNRFDVSAEIGERAMREIYLPAFQDAVRSGAASSVMCSYNRINGVHACEDGGLLNSVLRGQFGFKGFVTSDWGAVHSTANSANGGLDQDMPGGDGYYGDNLVRAVDAGQVSQATLNALTTHVLTEMFAFGLFDKEPIGSIAQTSTGTAHQRTGAEIAAEGTVLLKNQDGVLPLASSTKSIAVIGNASANAQTAGGGSANVHSSGTVTPLDGITSRAGSGISVRYDDGVSTASAAALAKSSGVAVVFVNKGESEGGDLGDIDLPGNQNSLISAVAQANPNTIVVLNTGSAVTMPWLDKVKGVFEAWYPGQGYGTAIASLLFGDTDPSGHLPVTFPKSLADVPARTAAQWPGVNGKVQYSEDVNVGYRHYDANRIEPLFPFGHGLSYTGFSFSDLHVGTLRAGGQAVVTATVTNTGSRAGADVAQLYVGQPSSAGEPPKQLQGFARVDLKPGESRTVTFPLTGRNLRHWDTGSDNWSVSTGDYRVSVGDSAAHLPLTGTLPVASAQLGEPLTLTDPGAQEGPTGSPVSLQINAKDTTSGQTPAFSATGLPAGTSVSATGRISGTPTSAGTSTVTVTAEDTAGALATTTFLWTVVPATSAVTTPLIGYNGLCLDLAGHDNTDGTKVDIFPCNGTNGQEWTEESDGTVHMAGKCLDVRAAGTGNGTPVQIYSCNGTGAQQWQRQTNGALLNPHSGKCLDDPAFATLPGVQVAIWHCNGGANQRWTRP